MTAVQLNQHANLFRDEAAYHEFVRLLQENLMEDECKLIFSDGNFIGTMMSPEQVREIMKYRILNRFAEQPDLLDELRQRMESDDLVD